MTIFIASKLANSRFNIKYININLIKYKKKLIKLNVVYRKGSLHLIKFNQWTMNTLNIHSWSNKQKLNISDQ